MNEGSETPPTEAPPQPRKLTRREIFKKLLPFAPKRVREDPLLERLMPQIVEDCLNITMPRREFSKWLGLFWTAEQLGPRIPFKIWDILKYLKDLFISPPKEPKEYPMPEEQPDKIGKVCVVENKERKILENATVSVNSTEGVRFYGYLSRESLSDKVSPDLVMICTREPQAANWYPVPFTEEVESLPEVPYFYPVEPENIDQIHDLVGITSWTKEQVATGKKIYVFNAGSFSPVARAIRHVIKKDRPLQIPTPGLVTLN